MNVQLFMPILLVISIITGLVVEAIKKMLSDTKAKYSSNVLTAIVSIAVSIIVAIAYVLINKATISGQLVLDIVALIILSFLVSMLGYDKVVQTIKQLGTKKEQVDEESKE